MVELRKSYSKVLYIDDREPLSFIEKVANNCTIPVEIKRLRTGDFTCEDVGIERKKLADFVGSMVSKKRRLWTQTDRMKKEFKYPYLVISGKTCDLDTEVTEHAIIGAIAALACPKFDKVGTVIEPPMTVVKVDTSAQLAFLILKIFERHGKLKLPPVCDMQGI